MLKEKKYTYKKAIVLTIQRLQELNDIILKHSDIIEYEATTANGASIKFDSFDELKRFDNCGEDRITSLILRCYEKNSYKFNIYIDFSPQITNNSETVRCQYRFSDSDKESVFITDLRKLLEKSTEYDTNYKICKWISFVFFIILGVHPVFFKYNGQAIYQYLGDVTFFVIVCILEFISTGFYYRVVEPALQRIFPRVFYVWGEEERNYHNQKNLRSNLFWGVIVATLINLAVGISLR